jgi:transglutaminase-like putative cysteine protease
MQKAPLLESVFRSLKSLVPTNIPSRAWDWQSALLVIVLVQIAAARLIISEWVPNLYALQTISLCAVVLGLLLGYSNFTGKISLWIAVEYALVIIPLRLLSAVDGAQRSEFLNDDLGNLLLRLFDSILLFFKNQPIYDPLFFILLTSIGFWIIGCYVGYRFTRHESFLETIFAPGLVMLIVQIYDPWFPLRAWALAIFIFAALALLGRVYYLENKKSWKKRQVFLSSDTEWEFSRSVLYSAALAVFIAWALPGAISSIKPISKAWRNFTAPFTERFSNAVTALESPYGTSASGDFYGSELTLGNNAPLSDTPVLFIETPKAGLEILRYYWRGRTYDSYQDGQWINSNSQRIVFDPSVNELNVQGPATRTSVDMKVIINFPKQELLYAPAEITWFSREGRLIVAPMEKGSQEVLGMVAIPGLVAGDSYEVEAMIATPTIQELRNAGTEYPAWVTERYLQVPEKIEPQLQELAEKVTASYTLPYDRAQAITSYLRRNIEYQTTLEETPPAGEDPLLWVLFEYQKGFCMYSASAEVLMLRTLGIPSRMAVGFAEGTYDEERDRYTVARLDAHAWPEVYFPGIGWVEFEPTGNQRPLDRPQAPRDDSDADQANTAPNAEPLQNIDEGPDNAAGFDPTLAEEDELANNQGNNAWMKFINYILLITVITAVVLLSRRYNVTGRLPVYLAKRYSRNGNPPPNWIAGWATWAQLLPIEKYYQTINLCLRWLGVRQPAHNTAGERANILAKVLPSAADDIQTLSHEYQNSVFAAHPADLKAARRASLGLLYRSWIARTFQYKEIVKRRYN